MRAFCSLLLLCGVGAGQVKDAWDNHFSAFVAQDVDKILKDYTDKSEIIVYNEANGQMTTHTGLDSIKKRFTSLFESLDTSDLVTPVHVAKDAMGSQPGTAFFIWSAKKSGYKEATDIFIFDSDGKIAMQNVVEVYNDPAGQARSDAAVDKVAPQGKGPVHSAWQKHVSAFGAHDVDEMLKGYTDQSVITVFNQADGKETVYKGLSNIKKRFTGYFKSFFDTSDLKVPVQLVKEDGSVLMIWSCRKSGYKKGMDTFIFDADGKILRQYDVIHYIAPKRSKQFLNRVSMDYGPLAAIGAPAATATAGAAMIALALIGLMTWRLRRPTIAEPLVPLEESLD